MLEDETLARRGVYADLIATYIVEGAGHTLQYQSLIELLSATPLAFSSATHAALFP
jgi:hypothetical protein